MAKEADHELGLQIPQRGHKPRNPNPKPKPWNFKSLSFIIPKVCQNWNAPAVGSGPRTVRSKPRPNLGAVEGLGFRVWGLEFSVEGLGFRGSSSGLRVRGFRFRP